MQLPNDHDEKYMQLNNGTSSGEDLQADWNFKMISPQMYGLINYWSAILFVCISKLPPSLYHALSFNMNQISSLVEAYLGPGVRASGMRSLILIYMP